jgi:hypothetical protein
MARKPNKTGRDFVPQYISIERRLFDSPAWRALSTAAQALYPIIRLEWKGQNNNNNGQIRLSVRQAMEKTGMGKNAAQRAFHDLQAKGFLHITELGALGISGNAKAPSFEITELPLRHSDDRGGRRLFDLWRKGHDYPVQKHPANNPNGRNGNKIPSPKQGRSLPQNSDVLAFPIPKTGTA